MHYASVAISIECRMGPECLFKYCWHNCQLIKILPSKYFLIDAYLTNAVLPQGLACRTIVFFYKTSRLLLLIRFMHDVPFEWMIWLARPWTFNNLTQTSSTNSQFVTVDWCVLHQLCLISGCWLETNQIQVSIIV